MANPRATKSKPKANKDDYVMVPVEIDGQTVMMKVLKPVAAPRGVTARCQG